MTKFTRTFGPIVFLPDDSDEMRAKCISGNHACQGYLGGKCLWADGDPFDIPNTNLTPDACQYKADALHDAKEMAANG